MSKQGISAEQLQYSKLMLISQYRKLLYIKIWAIHSLTRSMETNTDRKQNKKKKETDNSIISKPDSHLQSYTHFQWSLTPKKWLENQPNRQLEQITGTCHGADKASGKWLDIFIFSQWETETKLLGTRFNRFIIIKFLCALATIDK